MSDEKVVGFIGGYRLPNDPACLFVWQIAVSDEYRGQKLSHMMLERLLQAQSPVPIKRIEATYTPSNKASFLFFSRFAQERSAEVCVSDYLSEEDFGGQETGHEAEKTISITLNPDQ